MGCGATWSVDRACTSRICKNLRLFDKKTVKPKFTKVDIADGGYMTSTQTGVEVPKAKWYKSSR